jgi:hypothetical protein
VRKQKQKYGVNIFIFPRRSNIEKKNEIYIKTNGQEASL